MYSLTAGPEDGAFHERTKSVLVAEMDGLSIPCGSTAVIPLHLHPSIGVRSILLTSVIVLVSHTIMLLSPHSEIYIRLFSSNSPFVES